MCRRYALRVIDLTGQVRLIMDADIRFPSHFNIAPSSTNPVIVSAPEGNHLRMMEWGLIPHWAKDICTMPRPANARAESLAEKPMFRGLLAHHRCIVPASGFYEWRTEGTRKLPFYFHRKDGSLLTFAGLYDAWQAPTGETRQTYTIITTAANELMAPIHDRMPAILTREGEERWLAGEAPAADEMRELLVPCENAVLEAYVVSQRVNRPGEEDEGMILPVNGQGTI